MPKRHKHSPQPHGISAALRAVLYARVSTEEQADAGHSIDAQLRVLREFCARKGWQVVGEYVDAGYSGKTLNRPKIQALLRDANARAFDVIAVHKIDRFSRSLKDTINTLTELKSAGIGFASATQPIDLTTPEGKLMLMMLAVFAEIYIDNLSAETKKGREQRARKGFANGHVPFGYRAIKLSPTNDAERAVEFHPENIEGYRLAIRMCADGKRVSEIMQTLNAQGYRSTSFRGARPFSKDMLFPMLKNRFYLGEVSYKGEWMPGKHSPAIDVETWERAQAQIEKRAAWQGGHHRRSSRTYILRGLVFCGECGNRLSGWLSNGKTRYYRCIAHDKGETCSQPKTIRADKLETQIGEILAQLRLPDDWLARTLELLGESDDDRKAQEKQRTNLEGQLDRLRVVFQLGDISESAYRAERDRIRSEIQTLRPVKRFDLERAAQVLQNFGVLWNAATMQEQEEIAQGMIERIYTFDGRIVTIEPKTDFYPLLAIAAADAGMSVRDEGVMPFSPISRISSPVLVIVPPTYYRHRASIHALRDVSLSGSHGKAKNRPTKRKARRKAQQATRKRGTHARTNTRRK